MNTDCRSEVGVTGEGVAALGVGDKRGLESSSFVTSGHPVNIKVSIKNRVNGSIHLAHIVPPNGF